MFHRPMAFGFLSLIAAALCVLSVPTSQAEAVCGHQVTVGPGDTLSRIAARCGTTLGAILGENPRITDPNTITVGQVVHLPVDMASAEIAVEQATEAYGLCVLHATTGIVEADIRAGQEQGDGVVALDKDDVLATAFRACADFRADLAALLNGLVEADRTATLRRVDERLRSAASDIVEGASELQTQS